MSKDSFVKEEDLRYRKIRWILIFVLIANLAVAFSKGIVGWRVDSIAMVADAFHSLMDGSSNIIGLIGISLASRPRDESHLYGHQKFETFASIGVVILLLLTAIQIGQSVIERLTSESVAEPDIGITAFVVMLVTICINLLVSLYERRKGRQLSSTFLIADSRHTMSDIGVSLSVIAGLIAVILGYPFIDAVVGGIIAIVIAVAALHIMKEASFILLDRAVIEPSLIESVCMSLETPGLQGCHKIRSRGSEAGYWIDLHVVVDPEMSTRDSHKIASRVELRLKEFFGGNTDVVIHIEPGRK